MTDLRKAAERALDVIIELYNDRGEKCEQNKELFLVADKVIAALEAALAQPEQEPVAWMYVNEDGECEQIEYGACTYKDPDITFLYTAPPSKPDVNQELVEALKSVHSICKSDLQYRQFLSSREYEIMNICEPLIAQHKEQA